MTKINIYVAILLFIFTLSFSYAESAFKEPEYCKEYNMFYDSNSTKPSEEIGVYSSCLGGEFVEIGNWDIFNYWSNIESNSLESNHKSTKAKALGIILKSLQKNALSFEGLAGGKQNQLSRGMLSCLEKLFPDQKKSLISERDEITKKNNEKTNDYLDVSFDKAILLYGLLEEVERRTNVFDNAILMINMKMTTSLKLIGNEKLKKEYLNKIEEVKKSKKKFLKEFNSELKKLAINSPLLVSTENDFKLKKWYNSKMSISEVSKKLIGDLPKKLDNKIKGFFQKKSDSSRDRLGNSRREVPLTLDEIIQTTKEKSLNEGLKDFNDAFKNNSENEDFLSSYKKDQLKDKDGKIKDSLKVATVNYTEGIYKSLEENCDDKGEYIHYNSGVFSLLAKEIYEKEGLSSQEKKNSLMSLQQWQCKQWRDHPIDELDDENIIKKTGVVLATAGAVAMFAAIPFTFGSSGIAGSALMSGAAVTIGSVGAYTAAVGGGLLALNSANDYLSFRPEESQIELKYYMNWADNMTTKNQGSSRSQQLLTEMGLGAAASVAAPALTVAKNALGSVKRVIGKGSSDMTPLSDKIIISNNPISDVSETTKGLLSYGKIERDSPGILGKVRRYSQKLSGNKNVPVSLRSEDGSFMIMLNELVKEGSDVAKKSVKGSFADADRDEAFSYLSKVMDRYKNYPKDLESIVVRGRNAKLKLDELDFYDDILVDSLFEKKANGKYPSLPKLDPPHKLYREGGMIVMKYKELVKDKNTGAISLEDKAQGFVSLESLLEYKKKLIKEYDEIFAFSEVQRLKGRQDVAKAHDRQVITYERIRLALRKLQKEGEKNPGTPENPFPDMSDRQRDYMGELESLLSDVNFQPPAEAFNRYDRRTSAREIWEARPRLKSNPLKEGSSGFSAEAISDTLKNEVRERWISWATTLGIAIPSSGTVVVKEVFDILEKRSGLDKVEIKAESTKRAAQRKLSLASYPKAPHGFTEDEKKCVSKAGDRTGCFSELIDIEFRGRVSKMFTDDPESKVQISEDLLKEMQTYTNQLKELADYFGADDFEEIKKKVIEK